MKEKKQIDDLRREIAQFTAAIELMKAAPEAVEQIATLPDSPLGYLKALRQQATAINQSGVELEQAEAALTHSQARLSELEAEWATTLEASNKAKSRLHKQADRINKLSQELSAAIEELRAIGAEGAEAWESATGGNLYSESLGLAFSTPCVFRDGDRVILSSESQKSYFNNGAA